MTPMTNIFTKTEAIAAKNPPKPQRWVVVNACKSIIYKQTEALKGRLDHNHGCNPWTKTLAQHGCNPWAETQARHRCNPRTILLLFLLALCTLTTTAHAQTAVATRTYGGVIYTLWSDGTASVEPSPNAYGTLNLRETLTYNNNTYILTRIADGAFANRTSLTGSLTIPNTVTHIGSDAFIGCTGLTGTLSLPTALLHIGNGAFSKCGFTGALNLPNGLLTIGGTAFYQCESLTGQLNLPATLTSIGEFAFEHCRGFSGTLTLPPLLTEIEPYTFYGVPFTGDFVIHDGITTIGDYAFVSNWFSSINIGDGVTTIGNYAFRNCRANQLTLGRNVTSVGEKAFQCGEEGYPYISIECKSTIPPTLGANVFENYTFGVGGITVPCGAIDNYLDPVYGWAATYDSSGFLIGNGATWLSVMEAASQDVCIDGVYYRLVCSGHTATVMNSAFLESSQGASYSGDVVIPATVEYEGITYSVTHIAQYAFYYCQSVTSVTLGSNIQSIGDRAFGFCTGINRIVCQGTTPPTMTSYAYAFFNAYQNITLQVPCGALASYQGSEWDVYLINMMEGAMVEIDGVYYVLYCDGTANVTHAGYSDDDSNNGSYSGYVVIPGTVTYKGETHVVNRIGNNAFKGCVSLTDAIIGENVETIGDNAFEGCTALTRGGSGGDLANIGNNAFKGCTALTSVTIGENVENIGNNAFDGCTALSSITSERLEPPALGSDVFSGVPTSAVLNVPCTATEAYAAAAQWQDFNIQGVVAAYINAQIDGVYYVLNPCRGTATVTHAGYDEIANAHYMNSYPDAVAITIPETVTHEGATYDVTRIGAYAFLFSNSLTSIVIGEKVGYVGGDAFGGCSGLQSITSKNPTPPTLGWGGDVFQQVPTSAKLYVPCSAVEAYAAAEGWNRFETISELYYQIGNLYYSICGGTATVVYDDSYATMHHANVPYSITYGENTYYVTGIGDNAFEGCTALEYVSLHEEITTIGNEAFKNCSSIVQITTQAATPPVAGQDAFLGVPENASVAGMPFCYQYDYSVAPEWNRFSNFRGSGPCENDFMGIVGTSWSDPQNWSAGVVPDGNSRVGVRGTCEIDDDVTVGSITLDCYINEEYGLYDRLIVKSGKTLTANNFIWTTGDATHFIIEDGAQLIHPNAGAVATVEKNITAYTPNSKNGWHLVSSPAIESFAPTADNGFLANDYDLYFYDEPAHYWRNYKPNGQYAGFSIEPLKGYLYANSANNTLQLQGILREATAMVEIPLSYASADGILMGFNLVGNPFAHNVTTFTGTNVAEEVYQLNDLRNEVVVGSISETNPLQPGEGFFVKATGGNASITFNSRATNAERSLSQSKGCINLELRENGLVVDRFILKRDGAPLEKFTLNENGTKVFATEDAQDWAVVVIASEAKQSSPTGQAVNFKAAKDGEYTLSVNVENMDLDYLHLIDNLTGADVDLLPLCKEGQGDSTSATYTFQAKTTDYASRFKLVFSTNDASTGSASDAPFAYISDGNIIVNGKGTLQVIDMMGRVIVSHNGHTRCVSTAGMTAGVYVLRLIDGDSVRTQKIVVE